MEQQRDGGKAGTWTPAGVGSMISMCVSMCECLHMRGPLSHYVCMCMCMWGGSVSLYVQYMCMCVCVQTLCESMWREVCLYNSESSCMLKYVCVRQNARSEWICLLVLSVLAWWHLSVKMPLGGLTWLQRDKARDLRWATCCLMFNTEWNV